jgi:hypothetical protein
MSKVKRFVTCQPVAGMLVFVPGLLAAENLQQSKNAITQSLLAANTKLPPTNLYEQTMAV